MCDREVVEDEQFAGTQADLNADGFGMKFAVRRNRSSSARLANSVPQRKPGSVLTLGNTGGCPIAASMIREGFPGAGAIVPGAMAGAVGGKATEQLITIGPLANTSNERNGTSRVAGLAGGLIGSYMQSGETATSSGTTGTSGSPKSKCNV